MSILGEKTKRFIIALLRTGVSVSLAVLLIHFTFKSTDLDLAEFGAELVNANRLLLLAGLLLNATAVAVSFRRWQMLLSVQDIRLPFPAVGRLGMIGLFFNLAIPGAVSGDLLKMAYIARHAPKKKAEAVLAIVIDRVIGIMGLFIVATVMILVSLQLLLNLDAEYRPLQAAVFVVGLGSVGGIVAVLLVEVREKLVKHRWGAGLLDFGARKLPTAVTDTIRRFVDALELFRGDRRAVFMALGMSIFIHGSLGLNLLCLGRAVGEDRLRARDYFLAVQVGNAVAAIPVTPGGVGTRDATIATFLKACGATPEKIGVIPLALSLIMVLWALSGAVVFVLSPGLRAPPETAEAADPESG